MAADAVDAIGDDDDAAAGVMSSLDRRLDRRLAVESRVGDGAEVEHVEDVGRTGRDVAAIEEGGRRRVGVDRAER